MKRLCALILSGVICMAMTGCGLLVGTAQKKVTIDLIVKGTETEFWKSVNEGAQAAAAAYGVIVTMTGPPVEGDYTVQVTYLDDSIARKPNAIILAAANYSKMSQPVQRAIDAGIPVVMVDSDVENTQTVAYVGTDNKAIGAELAQQLCRRVTRSGSIGVLSVVKDSYTAVQRETGFCSGMEQEEQFTLLDTLYCDCDIDTARQLTLQMVAENPELVAIAALNAQAATGAARALSELERGDIQLFAVDCTTEEAMYIEEDILQVALLQNPYQMGYYSVETACRYLKGETVQKIDTDIYPVDKTTMFDGMYQQLIFPFETETPKN